MGRYLSQLAGDQIRKEQLEGHALDVTDLTEMKALHLRS